MNRLAEHTGLKIHSYKINAFEFADSQNASQKVQNTQYNRTKAERRREATYGQHSYTSKVDITRVSWYEKLCKCRIVHWKRWTTSLIGLGNEASTYM